MSPVVEVGARGEGDSVGDDASGEETAEERQAIGRRIHQARIASAQDNASAFAREIGVQPNSVYRYERGEQTPSVPVLAKIAAATGRTMEWLATGAEDTTDEVYLRWLDTPIGGTASVAARRFLETLPIAGYEVSLRFYDLALAAFDHGMSQHETVRASSLTGKARGRG